MNLRKFIIAAAIIAAVQAGTVPKNVDAHGSNPSHVDSWIKNPYSSTGKITSAAPNHWKLRLQRGDVSLDIVQSAGGTAGKSVYFNAAPRSSGDTLRGKVIAGGRDAPVYSCYADDPYKSALEKGGRLVKIQVEVKKFGTTTWAPVGWVVYAHLSLTTSSRFNGDYIYSGSFIGTVVDGLKVNSSCWTAPHVHMEAYDYNHYAGYVPLSEGASVSTSGNLFCVGGSRSSVTTCN